MSLIYRNRFQFLLLNSCQCENSAFSLITKKSRFLTFLGHGLKFYPPELYGFFWSQVMDASFYIEKLLLKTKSLYDLTACPHLGTKLCNLPHRPRARFKHEWDLMFLCLMKLNSFVLLSLFGHNEWNRVLFSQQLLTRQLDTGCWSLQPWLHETDWDDCA